MIRSLYIKRYINSAVHFTLRDVRKQYNTEAKCQLTVFTVFARVTSCTRARECMMLEVVDALRSVLTLVIIVTHRFCNPSLHCDNYFSNVNL